MPSAIATSTARARTLNADIWYAGKGQYSEGGGGSSCGLAALNCARVVLGLERKEPQDGNILDIMLQHDTTEEILRPCASWSSATHLDVDDIYRTPIFNKSLKLLHTSFGRPKVQEFKHVLARLAQTTRTTGASASVVITRPPEIISCLKLVTMTGGADSFVVYDSHPRPEHPDGAAFIVFKSLDNAATYIARLMNYEESLLADDDTQWQVQYLAQFSAHIFAARPMPFTAKELEDATLEASLDILNLKAKASELESQKENLLADQTRLTSRVAVLEDELRVTELREQNWRQLRRDDKRPRFGGLFKDSDQGADDARARSFSTKRGLGRLYTSIVPNDGWREGWYDSPRASGSNTRNYRSDVSGQQSDLARTRDLAHLSSSAMIAEDARLAATLQREFEREDSQLARQMQELLWANPSTFECGVCFETCPIEDVAEVESCGHQFCRSCIRGFVAAKIEEQQYPIMCPSCAVDARKGGPGVVDGALLQQLGLSEKQDAAFHEIQMAAFAVLLHCRHCQNSMFVDREELATADVVTCPLSDCKATWCKNCSQEVVSGGPKHSCDGTSEFQHLMESRGWRYCPGCQTPTEKIDGCNHMTCRSPGCNTHFCWHCGQSIVRSVQGDEIRSALQTHFATCRLFQDVPEDA